jgi:predicted metalloprotease
MFSDIVRSGCGTNSASTGPFYCPLDQKVYGHHIQNLVGTSDRVRQLQSRGDQADANALSVMLELQADCYAGAWAHHANRTAALLEPGDVEEGLAAAAAIGDDRLMRQSGRAVSPESFTHGTSQQRQRWLETGLQTGDLNACDTFR